MNSKNRFLLHLPRFMRLHMASSSRYPRHGHMAREDVICEVMMGTRPGSQPRPSPGRLFCLFHHCRDGYFNHATENLRLQLALSAHCMKFL